ncbi:MAG: protein kinase [Planctomycetia bacterium]|nr:protein kinase [Planctomycetia bacterium]
MIAFSCPQCGARFQVKPQFAGRASRCPGCKHALMVPAALPAAQVATGQIDGTPSSLARVGLDGGVCLDQPQQARGERKPVRDLLARRARPDQRYHIEGEIARGGMGAVLRAVDCDIRREVAVKYMLDQADAKKKSRFIEEAQITGQLEHPNIVPIHELGVDGQQRLFFSMKMVKGRSLAQVLDELRQHSKRAEQEYSLGKLLNILIGVCHALAYAHARDVIHRDLKPANIMLGDFGEVYVMDWGLAKVLGHEPATSLSREPQASAHETASIANSKVVTSREPEADLTQDGTVLGTPAYMPPEQATGRGAEIDRRSDVYSLGAILYEMLALVPPVEKDGGYLAVLMRVMEGQIAPPDSRAPQRAKAGWIPKELAAVAMKALARDKSRRYPSVEAFRGDLERFQEGRSVSAKDDTAREMVWKLVKRNKAVSAALVVLLPVLLFLLGSSLFHYWAYAREQQEKDERTRQAVPAFVQAARLLANDGQFPEAHRQVDLALDYERDYGEARLLKGQIFVVQLNWRAARVQLEQYLLLTPGDGNARKLLDLCARGKPDDTATLSALADVLQHQKADGLAAILLRNVQRSLEARRPLLALYQKQIEAAWPGLGHRLSLDPAAQFRLNINQQAQVTALHPLKGMQLNSLSARGLFQVADLSPLRGMPLTQLDVQQSKVRDLEPLRGMKLTQLDLGWCKQVKDLGPLAGLPLTMLNLASVEVTDLTPLRDMPLTWLDLHASTVSDLAPLRNMPLQWLSIGGCPIHDLSPLQGRPLTFLSLVGCPQVKDLQPLRGMPLRHLELHGNNYMPDLTPLEGMSLESLTLQPRTVKQGMEVVRRMKSLKFLSIDGVIRYTPEEFWKRYDAGEFK